MSEEPPLHAGDSATQRRAEGLMLDVFQSRTDLQLERPYVLKPTPTARMEFDAGALPEGRPGLLVEAWAHQGPPKAAQKKKIVADAFKLAFAAKLLPIAPRLVLLFSDDEAAEPFRSSRAWSAAAFNVFLIELETVELLPDERALIRQAQQRQYR